MCDVYGQSDLYRLASDREVSSLQQFLIAIRTFVESKTQQFGPSFSPSLSCTPENLKIPQNRSGRGGGVGSDVFVTPMNEPKLFLGSLSVVSNWWENLSLIGVLRISYSFLIFRAFWNEVEIK